MTEPTIVGLRPWLPWPLNRSRWWTEPVPAERLAALRIGLTTVLLLDILLTYLPNVATYFGPNSLGGGEASSWLREAPRWNWSVLGDVEDERLLRGAVVLWAVATGCLLVGLYTRTSAVVVWLLSTSFANLNSYIDNAGDSVRGIALFYLMLCPCGAAWSIDAWRSRRRRRATDAAGEEQGDSGRLIDPWPLRLLFVQMMLIYFVNGLYKVVGPDWRAGSSLYYVLNDLTLTRWSYAQVPVPYWLTQVMTWSVLGWELGFPVLVSLPCLVAGVLRLLRVSPKRREQVQRWVGWVPIVTLCLGALFHIGIGLSLEIGGFPAYMLCLYLPLLPWERSRHLFGGGPGSWCRRW